MKNLSVILFALFVTQAMAQTSGSSITSNTSSAEVSGSSFMRVIRDKLQIRYFSEFLEPNVFKWDDDQVDTTANGTEPIGMFHQFSVRWKMTGPRKIFLEPRLTTHFGSRSDLRTTDDQSAVRIEDFKAGVSDTYSIFVMYEHELQHNAKKAEKSFSYVKETLQDVYAGVNINFNPSLINPFICMAQLKKINDETLQVVTWIMEAIF